MYMILILNSPNSLLSLTQSTPRNTYKNVIDLNYSITKPLIVYIPLCRYNYIDITLKVHTGSKQLQFTHEEFESRASLS